jgi:hypothetical protein
LWLAALKTASGEQPGKEKAEQRGAGGEQEIRIREGSLGSAESDSTIAVRSRKLGVES